jgi:hypothetical protein
MSKKKFKDTKVGKILTSKVGGLIIGSIPGIGSIADNILDEAKGDGKKEVVSESGSVNWKNPKQIIGGVITLILLYLALSGKISFEDAEQAKDFINN